MALSHQDTIEIILRQINDNNNMITNLETHKKTLNNLHVESIKHLMYYKKTSLTNILIYFYILDQLVISKKFLEDFFKKNDNDNDEKIIKKKTSLLKNYDDNIYKIKKFLDDTEINLQYYEERIININKQIDDINNRIILQHAHFMAHMQNNINISIKLDTNITIKEILKISIVNNNNKRPLDKNDVDENQPPSKKSRK